jgi:hypothetical protein
MDGRQPAGRTAASVVRHHLRRRPRIPDLSPTKDCLELVDPSAIELVVGPSSGCSGRLGGGHLDRYADLFDDDLDVVADRLDVVAHTARISCGLFAD